METKTESINMQRKNGHRWRACIRLLTAKREGKRQWSNSFNILTGNDFKSEFYNQLNKHELDRYFQIYKTLKNVFLVHSLRKLLEDVLHQNEGLTQEKGGHGLQHKRNQREFSWL